VLVKALATQHSDGTLDVLVWNGTINAELMHGDSRLDRQITVRIDGLTAQSYRPSLARVDSAHSNILVGYPADLDWPDEALWRELRERDHLHEERHASLQPARGHAEFELELPMPGIARIRLVPLTNPDGDTAVHNAAVDNTAVDNTATHYTGKNEEVNR